MRAITRKHLKVWESVDRVKEANRCKEELHKILLNQPHNPQVYALWDKPRNTQRNKIKLFVADKECKIHDITYWAARAAGMPLKEGYILLRGVGEDFGYSAVEKLSVALYSPDGKWDREAANVLQHNSLT